MKNPLVSIASFFLSLLIVYGIFRLEIYLHYKYGYQEKVKQEIAERVRPLEYRIKQLENQQLNK